MKTTREYIHFYLLLALCTAIVLFNSCSKEDDELDKELDNSSTYDKGVFINGVKWTTRNVGAPGTFVQNPEDYGNHYQFNKGTTDFLLLEDYLNSAYANSNSWLPANDPSPAGYRVPTFKEIQSLCDTTYVTNEWISLNGVNGKKFTDKRTGNSIFLPAADARNDDGTLFSEAILFFKIRQYGYYWSSTGYGGNNSYYLGFYSDEAFTGDFYDHYLGAGHSIRPVAK